MPDRDSYFKQKKNMDARIKKFTTLHWFEKNKTLDLLCTI